MKRVVVTGGSGFVGANLVRRLLRDGHEVHLFLRPCYQSWRINAIRDHVRLHELHLDDPEAVSRSIGQIRPDWIFHLAAHGAYSWQTDLQQMVQINVQGTMNLMTACLKTGFDAFVNAGTSSEYGCKTKPPSENEFLEPNSHYAVTKSTATLFCSYTAKREKVSAITLRLYSVYGAFEDPNRLIPSLILHGLRAKYPPLVTPETARDYVYIDDAVEAFLLAATSRYRGEGEVFNIGTGKQTTIADVVAVAKRVLHVSDEPVWGSMPNRAWDTHTWVANNTHAVTKLGWSPQVDFENGFKKTVEWMTREGVLLSDYKQKLNI